jgi:hypothetical protein
MAGIESKLASAASIRLTSAAQLDEVKCSDDGAGAPRRRQKRACFEIAETIDRNRTA